MQQVCKDDIDVSRSTLSVAFMRQAQFEEEVERERTVERALSSSGRYAWHGTFNTMYRTVELEAGEAYRAKRDYQHCELCFFCSTAGAHKFGADYMISCGARDGGGVQIVARKFNKSYTWMYLTVTSAEQEHIVDFLFAQRGKRYDRAAVLAVYTQPRVSTGRSWFCSELVATALQMLPCARLHSRRANCLDIDDVYELISRSTRLSDSGLNIAPQQVNAVWREGKFDAFATLFQN